MAHGKDETQLRVLYTGTESTLHPPQEEYSPHQERDNGWREMNY